MDLKALIAKMDEIESKKILTESESRPDAKKKETTWTDKSGKKHPATQVQGHQSVKADKEAEKEKKKDMDESIVLRSAIAKELLKEFNIDVEEAGPVMTRSDNQIWWDNNFPGQPFPGEAAAEKAYNDRMAAGQKNLDALKGMFGGKKKPAGGQAAQPAAAPAGTPAGAVDDQGNIMPGFTTDENGNVVKASDPNFVEPATQALAQQGRQAAKEKEFAANADAEDQAMGQAMAANAAAAQPAATAAVPPGINPETGEKYDSVANAPLQLPPGAAPEPGMTVAGGNPAGGGQAAQPAKTPAASDPKVKALQDKLIAAGAKIKADGIMGPATQAAMKQFPQAVSGNLPLPPGVKPSTAGAGRGGQGGPTAAELAQAQSKPAAGAKPAAGGQAAQPAAGGASQVPPTADKSKPYWVGGTRYEYKQGRGGGSWQVTATPQDKLQWNSTRARSMSGYTGADDQYKPGGATATAKAPTAGQAASPANPQASQGQGGVKQPAYEDALIARIRELSGL